jgi:hypothetical protein
MRTPGTRRVALLAGAATAAVVALAGCSAGQVAETSLKRPSNQGVNTQNAKGSVLIRNLSVQYNSPAGYQPGTDAPIEVSLFNQTKAPITVSVSSGAPAAGAITATQIALKGGASSSASVPAAPVPSASASAAPDAPAGTPAQITIAPMGTASFLPGDKQTLEAVGLQGKLQPGQQLSLVFEFSDGSAALPVMASVATPLTPAPRASGNADENSEE